MDLSFVQNMLHSVSQGLTYPVIILLLIAIGYSLFEIGSIIVEYIFERRHFKVALPEFLRAIDEAEAEDMADVVKRSGLLLRQKKTLLTLFQNRDLPEEARWALAKKLLSAEISHKKRVTDRNDTIAKVAPMLGLMGTLIPLGPGIVALGQGDTQTLSNSLLMAFDTTVAGLITAVVCMIISKIRKRWYTEYSDALEAGVTTMLEKIELLEKEGKLGHVDHNEVDKLERELQGGNGAAKQDASAPTASVGQAFSSSSAEKAAGTSMPGSQTRGALGEASR
jgi:biopolymer transport protein ExbB/TolQ